MLLSGCETVAPNAARFSSVPLKVYSKDEQAHMAKRIAEICGDPPACSPGTAESWILDYIQLRAMVRAAGKP
jgi:hypothetical protein